MAVKKVRGGTTAKARKQALTRKKRIRKRIFGITSLILAVVVANIPIGASAVTTESQLVTTWDPTAHTNEINWYVNNQESTLDGIQVTQLKVDIQEVTTAAEYDSLRNGVLGRLNTNVGNTLDDKAYIGGQYTDAVIYKISYQDFAGNVYGGSWGTNDRVVLRVADLNKEIPSGPGSPTYEDWDGLFLQRFGSEPLVLAYTGTAWIVAEGAFKPEVSGFQFGELDGISINNEVTYLAIVYRAQVAAVDTRSGVQKGEAHASALKPVTNGNVYSRHVEFGDTMNWTGYGSEIRSKVEAISNVGAFEDEDYYQFNMRLETTGTGDSQYYYEDADVSDPDPEGHLDYAVSVPLPEHFNAEKGTFRVFTMSSDGSGSINEITANVRAVKSVDDVTALQFVTDWFDDVAVVFEPTSPRYTVTVAPDPSQPGKGNPYIEEDPAPPSPKTSKRVFLGDSVKIEGGPAPGNKVSYWMQGSSPYTPAGSRERFTVNSVSADMDFVCFYEDDDGYRNVTVQSGDGNGNPAFGNGKTSDDYNLSTTGDINIFPNSNTGMEIDYWEVNDERVDIGAGKKSIYGVDAEAADESKLVLNNLHDDTIVIAYYKDSSTPSPRQYSLKLSAEGSGVASATDDPNTPNKISTTGAEEELLIDEGGTYYIKAVQNTGNTFLHWEITPEGGSPTYAYTPEHSAPITGNVSAKAVFADEATTKTITLETTTGGGVSFDNVNFSDVPISRDVPGGQKVQIYAKEDAGYTFTGWTLNDQPVSTNLSFGPEVTEDVTYVANFVHVGYNRVIREKRGEQLLAYQPPSVSPNSDLPGSGDEILMVSDDPNDFIGDIDTILFNQGLFTDNARTYDFNLQLYYTPDGTTLGNVVDDYDYNPLQVISLELPKFMNTRSLPVLYYLDRADNTARPVPDYNITTNSAGARVVTFTPPAMTDYALLQTIDASEFVMDVVSTVSNGTAAVTPQKPDPLPGDRTLTINESNDAKNNATAKLGTTVAYNDATAFTVRMTNSQTGAEADDVGNITIKLPLPTAFDSDLGTITAYQLDNSGNATPVVITPTIAKENGITYATIPDTKEYNDDYLFLFREAYTFYSVEQRTRYRGTQDATAQITSPADIANVVQGHRRIVFRDSTGSTIMPLINNDNNYRNYAHKDPFDISYTDENFNVMPSSEFITATVSLTIEDKPMPDLTLVTVGTDGNIEEIPYSKNGNVLAFTTSHFTDHALLYNDPAGTVRVYVEVEGQGSVLDDNNQAVTDYVEVDANSSVNLWARATDPANTRFVGWKDTTTGQATGNPSTQARQAFEVGTENRWLTAVFEDNTNNGGPYAVTAYSLPNGVGGVTGANSSVPAGESVTLTATPVEGYTITWYDNSSQPVATGNTYMIPNIDRNHEVFAIYTPTGGNNSGTGGNGSTPTSSEGQQGPPGPPGQPGQPGQQGPPGPAGTVQIVDSGGHAIYSGTGATTIYLGGGTVGKNISNYADMPRTGIDQAMVYKMLAVVILVMFGVIELLGSVNTKKRRVIVNG